MSVLFAPRYHKAITWVASVSLFLFKSYGSSVTRKGERQSMKKRRTLFSMKQWKGKLVFFFFYFQKSALLLLFELCIWKSFKWFYRASASQFIFFYKFSLKHGKKIWKLVLSACQVEVVVRVHWEKNVLKSWKSEFSLWFYSKSPNLSYMIHHLQME